ncbi:MULTISPECIES: hypothetical protein [unclassified Rathayibacter]|uniref:hypothetical protein n=1 Tax=unclassified Rathayibacter TaxID=2609250 RepID=UPI001FB1F44F|nr:MULTISPECIES: hypothetical protein [unclassified Rathayibacter]MCJ1674348.1 hypothetical protein [Rathayibacter sp. VKM Ac-2929]MCJ1684629.1 hypothetical protein [Rathayibacter sp. VKM Ac-2928]
MRKTSTTPETRWGAPRSRLGLIVFTVCLVSFFIIGAVFPEVRHSSPLVTLLVMVPLLAFVPRAIPLVERSWLLERTTPRATSASYYSQGAVGLVGATLAPLVDSQAPILVAAGLMLVIGSVVVVTVPTAP